MEPRLPSPERGPESPPFYYGGNLEQPRSEGGPESAIERKSENLERSVEHISAEHTPATPVAPLMPTLPMVQVQVDDTVQPASDGSPLIANDDDLIEREWVDKAKKIITATKDDPYMRERELGKLQADYLKKRYGKELGASD